MQQLHYHRFARIVDFPSSFDLVIIGIADADHLEVVKSREVDEKGIWEHECPSSRDYQTPRNHR